MASEMMSGWTSSSILGCLSPRFHLEMRLRMGRGFGCEFGSGVGGGAPDPEVVGVDGWEEADPACSGKLHSVSIPFAAVCPD
eukprot:870400-Rhodomonas_salina.1